MAEPDRPGVLTRPSWARPDRAWPGSPVCAQLRQGNLQPGEYGEVPAPAWPRGQDSGGPSTVVP